MKRIELVVPPYAEQKRIAEHIADATGDMSAALDRARQEISLLREHLTRLTGDVVTGKLDVRAAAARMPDEADELEPLDEGAALAEIEEVAADDRDAASEEIEA